MDLENPNNGGDSGCSTPYVSAPSSPGRGSSHNGYFFSAPASPMHFVLSSSATLLSSTPSDAVASSGSFEFDLSASACSAAADELFLNGQIRPMKQQQLAPLIDDDEEDEVEVIRGRDLRMRSRSMHRRTRSMSPLRRRWPDDDEETERKDLDLDLESDANPKTASAEATTTPSSSRSSSSGRNSKRWEFLKDLLYRSKSEGRGSTGGKEKFWHSLAFSSPSSSKSKPAADSSAAAPPPPPKAQKKKAAGSSAAGKRRASAHERHYTANRAAAEEMRRRTFLPYRQGLLGCLGFSSRGYGAVNGFARALNPVSSR